MTLLVKITLAAALLLSIAIPFGAFTAGEKTKGRYKKALALNKMDPIKWTVKKEPF